MMWHLEFYHRRRGLLARYDMEAVSPEAAVSAGLEALRLEYPFPRPRRGRRSLLERADRAGGGDGTGWTLHRIRKVGGGDPDPVAGKGERPVARSALIALFLMAALIGIPGSTRADVPTALDAAACNRQAREEVRSGTASPIARDTAQAEDARRAENARQGGPGPERDADRAATVTRSPDPQIDGMDAEGARDAAYRAAYRVCMRQKGF